MYHEDNINSVVLCFVHYYPKYPTMKIRFIVFYYAFFIRPTIKSKLS